MSLSICKIPVSNPVKGTFHETPWEYKASLSLGNKTANIDFRSKWIINNVTLEISKYQMAKPGLKIRKEYSIKIINPEDVNMSQIMNLSRYSIDMDRSSPTECILFKIKNRNIRMGVV